MPAEQRDSLEKVRFAPSEALGGEGVCCPEQSRGQLALGMAGVQKPTFRWLGAKKERSL